MTISITQDLTIVPNPATAGQAVAVSFDAATEENNLLYTPTWAPISQSGGGSTITEHTADTIACTVSGGTINDKGGYQSDSFKLYNQFNDSWNIQHTSATAEGRGGGFGLFCSDVQLLVWIANPQATDADQLEIYIYGSLRASVTIDWDSSYNVSVSGDPVVGMTVVVSQGGVEKYNDTILNGGVVSSNATFQYVVYSSFYTTTTRVSMFSSTTRRVPSDFKIERDNTIVSNDKTYNIASFSASTDAGEYIGYASDDGGFTWAPTSAVTLSEKTVEGTAKFSTSTEEFYPLIRSYSFELVQNVEWFQISTGGWRAADRQKENDHRYSEITLKGTRAYIDSACEFVKSAIDSGEYVDIADCVSPILGADVDYSQTVTAKFVAMSEPQQDTFNSFSMSFRIAAGQLSFLSFPLVLPSLRKLSHRYTAAQRYLFSAVESYTNKYSGGEITTARRDSDSGVFAGQFIFTKYEVGQLINFVVLNRISPFTLSIPGVSEPFGPSSATSARLRKIENIIEIAPNRFSVDLEFVEEK